MKPGDDDDPLTDEVGDEGGTPNNLEERHFEIGTGSEAGETWRPEDERTQELPRDETPPGRRSP